MHVLYRAKLRYSTLGCSTLGFLFKTLTRVYLITTANGVNHPKKKKKLYSPEIKETQNAKGLSAHHGRLLKLFSLQTKSPLLSNGSTRFRERKIQSPQRKRKLISLTFPVPYPMKKSIAKLQFVLSTHQSFQPFSIMHYGS